MCDCADHPSNFACLKLETASARGLHVFSGIITLWLQLASAVRQGGSPGGAGLKQLDRIRAGLKEPHGSKQRKFIRALPSISLLRSVTEDQAQYHLSAAAR